MELLGGHHLDLLDLLLDREGVVPLADLGVVLVQLVPQDALQIGDDLGVLLLGAGGVRLDGHVEHLGDFLDAPLAGGGQVL